MDQPETDKPILLTSVRKDGVRRSLVWHPFWGERPKESEADAVVEREDHKEFIFYE